MAVEMDQCMTRARDERVDDVKANKMKKRKIKKKHMSTIYEDFSQAKI